MKIIKVTLISLIVLANTFEKTSKVLQHNLKVEKASRRKLGELEKCEKEENYILVHYSEKLQNPKKGGAGIGTGDGTGTGSGDGTGTGSGDGTGTGTGDGTGTGTGDGTGMVLAQEMEQVLAQEMEQVLAQEMEQVLAQEMEQVTKMITKIMTKMITKIITEMRTKIITEMRTKIITEMRTKIITEMRTKIMAGDLMLKLDVLKKENLMELVLEMEQIVVKLLMSIQKLKRFVLSKNLKMKVLLILLNLDSF